MRLVTAVSGLLAGVGRRKPERKL